MKEMKIENIGDLFEAMMEHIEEESTTLKKSVGKVSDELFEFHSEMDVLSEDLKDRINDRTDELLLQAKMQIKKEFKNEMNEATERKRNFWKKVYAELNIDPKKSYAINYKTGEVYEKIK